MQINIKKLGEEYTATLKGFEFTGYGNTQIKAINDLIEWVDTFIRLEMQGLTGIKIENFKFENGIKVLNIPKN